MQSTIDYSFQAEDISCIQNGVYFEVATASDPAPWLHKACVLTVGPEPDGYSLYHRDELTDFKLVSAFVYQLVSIVTGGKISCIYQYAEYIENHPPGAG